MRKNTFSSRGSLRVTAICCAAFTVLGYILFSGELTKPGALAAGVLMIWLLATRSLEPLRAPAAWLLLGYVVFSGLTGLWAISGKFFLREYLKIFTAAAAFLILLLREEFNAASARRAAAIVAGSSAAYAFLSVEAITIGLMKALMSKIPGTSGIPVEYNGVRMYGIFGNSNVEATVFALGLFLSVALLCSATEDRRERIVDAVLLAFNAFAFLLVFSMLATVCFALAILCYLCLAGKQRAAVLIHMFFGAIPALLCGVAATTMFGRGGLYNVVPLLLLLLSGALTALLELRFADRLIERLAVRGRLVFGVLLGMIVLVAVYVIAGVSVTGAYTFGSSISRAAAPSPGERVLTVAADGDVQVSVVAQNNLQVLTGSRPVLYSGDARAARFTVPEDAEIVRFTFTAEPGTTLSSAVLDDGTSVPLDYPLIPSFAAARLQGVWASNSVRQRLIYVQDGLKLWRQSPAVGLGVGSFETAITSVQDYKYESRYIHNHYVQIMVEDGLIGLVLWVAALLSAAVLLIRNRRAVQEGPYGWLYGALWAVLVMIATQTFVDVSLSYFTILVCFYACLALTIRVCAQPERVPEAAAKRVKKAAQKSRDSGLLLRVACCALPCVFLLTLCAHLLGQKIAGSGSNYEAYLSGLVTAAKLDPYEHNDMKLTYLDTVSSESPMTHQTQADRFADELSTVWSNSLPLYLESYYIQTGRYDRAIDEAIATARYSASDIEKWNVALNLLHLALISDPYSSPLRTESETLLPKLMDYRAMLIERNETAWEPITLSLTSAQFLVALDDIAACGGDSDRITELLIALNG